MGPSARHVCRISKKHKKHKKSKKSKKSKGDDDSDSDALEDLDTLQSGGGDEPVRLSAFVQGDDGGGKGGESRPGLPPAARRRAHTHGQAACLLQPLRCVTRHAGVCSLYA